MSDYSGWNRIIPMETIDSTSNFIKENWQELPDRTVVSAAVQTGGKGRHNRRWMSPPGGLWFSLLLKPEQIALSRIAMLTLYTALGVRTALKKVANINADIKWPNDLLINGKKICGILCETSSNASGDHCVVVGIGINLNIQYDEFHESIRELVTSVAIETGVLLDKEAVLDALLEALSNEYARFFAGVDIIDEYKSVCITIGSQVQLERAGKTLDAYAQAVDKQGGLVIVHTDGHMETVNAGEVSIKRGKE